MSPLTITRIANVLGSQFRELIDMADYQRHPPDQREPAFLSRALAALCIRNLAGADPDVAARALTDGYNDGGLDAIHYDTKTDTLLLVQAKWSANGNKSLGEIEANKFVQGVRDLLGGHYDRFDPKIRAKEPEIRAILSSERPVRLRLVTIHTGNQKPAPHATRSIEDLVAELNDPVTVASYDDYDQAGVYGLITAETADPKIKLQIVLHDYGLIDKPFLSYYGRIHVSEIAQWWVEHRNFLFTQNLRLFKTNSDVNTALQKTLTQDPENFWYFNNGITVICDSVQRAMAGATSNKLGLFNCEGVSIVNGAQTVGTIGTVLGSGVADRCCGPGLHNTPT